MLSDEVAPRSVISTDAEKRDFALRSHEWNRKQKRFRHAFPDVSARFVRDNHISDQTCSQYCGEEMRDLPNMGEPDRGIATEEPTGATSTLTQPPEVRVSTPTIPIARIVPLPIITHEMVCFNLITETSASQYLQLSKSVGEILVHLGQHGCNNVTRQLDEYKSSEYPVSDGGFGDVYQGSLRDGRPVSLKCLRMHLDSTEDAKKQLKVRTTQTNSKAS